MSGRNGDISLLVQQLKSGQISKSELFNHLVVIHQSRTAPDAGPGAQAPPVPASNALQQAQALQASHAHQAASADASMLAGHQSVQQAPGQHDDRYARLQQLYASAVGPVAPAPGAADGSVISVAQFLQQQQQQQQQPVPAPAAQPAPTLPPPQYGSLPVAQPLAPVTMQQLLQMQQAVQLAQQAQQAQTPQWAAQPTYAATAPDHAHHPHAMAYYSAPSYPYARQAGAALPAEEPFGDDPAAPEVGGGGVGASGSGRFSESALRTPAHAQIGSRRRPLSAQARPQSAGRVRPRGTGLRVSGGGGDGDGGSVGARRSLDDSDAAGRGRPSSRGGGGGGAATVRRFEDMRTHAERAEAEARREAEKECTFKPKINELPSHYGGASRSYERLPFEERVLAWHQSKLDERSRMQDSLTGRDLDGCTFRPAINDASRRTAERLRAPDVPPHERLYQSGMKKLQEKERVARMKEAEQETEFPFEPQVRARAKTPVQPRYQQPAARAPRAKPPSELEECTFAPRVNSPARSMGAARKYLQQPVFKRLAAGGVEAAAAAAAAAEGGDGGLAQGSLNDTTTFRTSRAHAFRADRSGVVDASAFVAAQGGGGGGGELDRSARRRSTGELRARSVGPGPRGGGGGGGGGDASGAVDASASVSSTERKQRFESFIKRQEQLVKSREAKVEELRAKMTPSGKPRTFNRSQRLAESATAGGSFLDRLAADALRKQHHAMRSRAAAENDPECTFRPAILPSSRQLPPRSVVEMSRGDMLRRETAQRMMKLKAEQDEMQGLTFRPKVYSARGESRLKVLSDPDSYLDRLAQEERAFAERQRRALEEQEEREVRECTFRPQVRDAPEYVKRIAKAMRTIKQARREKDEATRRGARPAWQ